MTSAIEVNNLSKRYRKGRGLTNLRELLAFRGRSEAEQYHWAVRDVSFAVQPGEALGIIGPNGAGKTTILKLLSSVTRPTSGDVRVNGRFSALIELGAGFHPDLTGRENVFLNGAILGMKRDEIQQRFDQIVDFAGIGDYLDTPVKRYSSGMYARLGFAIAAHVDPDVLLVDEVLAVGDYAFQQKCHARMDQLRASGTSLIFVSHNFDAVRRVCDRGMVMYHGASVFCGTSSDAVAAYSDKLRSAARSSQTVQSHNGLAERVMSFGAEIEELNILDLAHNPVSSLRSGQVALVAMKVRFNEVAHDPVFSMFIRTADGRLVYSTTTRWQGMHTGKFRAGERYRVVFKIRLNLLAGLYDLGGDVVHADLSRFMDRVETSKSFSVTGGNSAKGICELEAEIRLEKRNESEAF